VKRDKFSKQTIDEVEIVDELIKSLKGERRGKEVDRSGRMRNEKVGNWLKLAGKGGVDAGAQKGPVPSRKTVENVLNKAVSCSSCWS